LNYESTMLVAQGDLITEFNELAANYRAVSHELTLEEWNKRSFARRYIDNVMRLSSALQSRLVRYKAARCQQGASRGYRDAHRHSNRHDHRGVSTKAHQWPHYCCEYWLPKAHDRGHRPRSRAHESRRHRRRITHDDAIGGNTQQQRQDNPAHASARQDHDEQHHIAKYGQG